MAAARNIFRESAIIDSPPNVPFSPSLPQNTPKRVFAPGGTPHPSRVQREFTAHATPRGMAAPSTERDLFSMRIKSPPRELTGEVLANKVPKDWNSKGSIYADQFLAHLCPPDLDDEQRRQFFCILDLRRLKYAANEIFSKKDWKLNVINFAKEFEKSRSIILLRYGLYEFQNVKPSKDVLRRWRREHGLPEPNEDEVEDAESTPSKPTASKKRKANDDLAKDTSSPHIFANAGKRRVTTQDDDAPPAAAPAPTASKNKRKASVGEDQATQPNKLQKATPSSAKSLFEKIANKPTPKPSNEASAPTPKASLFGSNKPVNGSLARSVFNNTLKAQSGQAGPAGNGNIFGYLSDASSAKNSGVEADAESDTESDAEDSPEAGQSDEPSTIASGVGETSSQLGSSLFNTKPLSAAGFGAGSSSPGGTRESTPGRSLFDRVSTDQDGQLLRSEKAPEPVKSTPADQTWNPSTTPIKFAPSAGASQTSSLFGKTAAAAPSSVFAPKSTASSNIFGTSNQSQSSGKDSAGNTTSDEADKTGGESDKENDSHVSKKTATESKAPATQPSLGNSLFQLKPPSTAPSNEGEPSKPTSSLFGTAPKTDASAPSNLFGLGKPAVPVTQAPSLFGAKPSQPEKKSETETPLAAAPLFGAQSKSTLGGDNNPAASLFGIKPAANTTNLFGTATPAPATSLFGTTNAAAETSKSSNPDPAPVIATPATPAPPLFSFGAKSATTPQAAAKPLFGIPTSPPGDSGANMFGSPMKQDEASPAKKPFAANQDSGTSKPIFSFGGTASTPSTNLFGASTTAAPGAGSASIPAFGAGASTNGGSAGFGGFNFGADTSASSGNTFNNPFSSGSNGNNSSQPSASSTGGMFNFGGAPAATPAASSGGLFQFGNASGSTTPLGGSVFGGNQSNQTSAPLFGGSTTTTSAPAFNITAPVSQPTQTQNNPFAFGAGQTNFGGSLQPPIGGSSTTGTSKSSFQKRKIAPLKRRV